MLSRSGPPPVPEEYKGLTPAPPPPSPANRSRPNSQAGGRTPPPAPGRSPANFQREASTRSAPGSQSNRPPPPTPNMAEIENARHTAKAPHPPTQPKQQVEDLDALENSKSPLFFRKVKEYKQKAIQCQKSQHALERAIICFIAICMLWVTSLAICQSIVYTFIRAPPTNLMVNAANKSMEGTQTERDQHDACATRVTSTCSNEIDVKIEAEKLSVQTRLLRNDQRIALAYQMRDFCNKEVTSGVNTFTFLQKFTTLVNPQITFGTTLMATDPRCKLVDDVLKGGSGGIQALGATDRYIGSADGQITTTVSAIDARKAYDHDYVINKTNQLDFIGNGTLVKLLNDTAAYFSDLNKTYDMFMACNSPSRTYNGQLCPTDSALSKVKEIQDQAQARYNNMKFTAESWYADAKARVKSVNDFCSNLVTNGPLHDAMNVFLNLNGFPTLEGMGLTSLSFIPDMNLNPFNTDDLNLYMQQLQLQTQVYVQSVVDQSKQAAANQLALQKKQLNFSVDNPLPPYDPPPVDGNGTISGWRNQSGPFLNDMANTLNGAANQGEQAAVFIAEVNVSDSPQNVSSQFLSNLQPRDLSFYAYNISVDDLLNAWNSLVATALTFDYLYRVFHSFQLIRKYWRVSAISLPPADVRTDLMQNKGLAINHNNIGQKIAMCIAHPATTCLVMAIIALIMFSLLLAIYLPIYNNYKAGCIDGGVDGNGTMISQNAYQLSYAYAMSSGDRKTTIVVDRINARKEVACSEQVDYSTKAFEAQQKEWNFVMGQHRDLQYRSFALNDCINIPAVQAFNVTAAVQATGGNFTTLQQMIPGGNCSGTIPVLEDAVYNCSHVQCNAPVTCVGANQAIMKLETFKASCYVEWYLHATFLGSIMVTVTFILCNCSRIFIMRGLIRIFWRYLSDGNFSYLGTCDRAGDLKYPSLVTDKGYSMKRAIRESLAHRLMYWEAKSTGLFIFGVLLNVPWMYTLGYLSSNLAVRDLESL